MNEPVWSRAHREEVIALLWLIAGILAFEQGWKWLAICAFVITGVDLTLGFIYAAVDWKNR